ncbi:Heavy metal RND efflux outer membrane protein, CzcC family [Planctomycetales bacterium 10988]|nr:Heavy metal RND efflux outer membrane protein, CzcC family [Planctomycetales bacterium 10988]
MLHPTHHTTRSHTSYYVKTGRKVLSGILLLSVGCVAVSQKDQKPAKAPSIQQTSSPQNGHQSSIESKPTIQQVSHQSSPSKPEVIPSPAAQSLGYYMGLAQSQHPQVQAARWAVSATMAKIPQARALEDPLLTGTLWPIADQSVQTASGRVATSLMLMQKIPWPEKLHVREEVAKRELQMALANLQQTELDILLKVQLAYYDLWFNQRALKLLKENNRLSEQLVQDAKSRYRTGGSQKDVLQAQLEVDRIAEQLLNYQRQQAIAQNDLATAISSPLGVPPQVPHDLELQPLPQQLDLLLAAAERANPNLKAKLWAVSRDRQKRELACLERYPNLQVGSGWSLVTEEEAISPVADGHDQVNLTLGMTVPLWKERIDAGIREASAKVAQSSQEWEAEKETTLGKIKRLYETLELIEAQREIYRERVLPRSEQTIQLAIAEYRGNKTDFDEVLDLFTMQLMLKLQAAQLDATYAKTMAQLDHAVGVEITSVAQ